MGCGRGDGGGGAGGTAESRARRGVGGAGEFRGGAGGTAEIRGSVRWALGFRPAGERGYRFALPSRRRNTFVRRFFLG